MRAGRRHVERLPSLLALPDDAPEDKEAEEGKEGEPADNTSCDGACICVGFPRISACVVSRRTGRRAGRYSWSDGRRSRSRGFGDCDCGMIHIRVGKTYIRDGKYAHAFA